MPVLGGQKFHAAIRKAIAASGVNSIEVGFFQDAEYPDGTPVAAVAAAQEFGVRLDKGPDIPERPFFRQALRKVEDDVREVIEDGVNSRTLVVDENLADNIGGLVAGAVSKSISDGPFKELSEVTLHRRRTRKINPTTSDKPLVDTATLRTAPTWKVERD